MRLITEDTMRELGAPSPSFKGVNPSCFEEPVEDSALRAFLTLTQASELFLEAGWSPEAVFWSRYFWFRRFSNARTSRAGADAGLEQQATQILESPHPSCDPDWSQLELVERLAATGEAPNTSLERTRER